MEILHKTLNIYLALLENQRIYNVTGFENLHGNNHLELREETTLLFTTVSNTSTFQYLACPMHSFPVSDLLYHSSILGFPFIGSSEFNTSSTSLTSLPWSPSLGLKCPLHDSVYSILFIILIEIYLAIIIFYIIFTDYCSYINLPSIQQDFWGPSLSSSLSSIRLIKNRVSINICCMIEWTNLLKRHLIRQM